MSLVDLHEIGIEKIVALHGGTITLIDKNNNQFLDVKCLFNAVDYGLNLDSVNGDPLGEKTNVYIQTKELISKSIVIDNDTWLVKGKKGKYTSEETFLAEIPKQDHSLPGVILFLSLIDPDAVQWENVSI